MIYRRILPWLRTVMCMVAVTFSVNSAASAQDYHPLVGNDNPVVAFNLAAARDLNTGMQFLNLMKMARPWMGHSKQKFGALKLGDLRREGYIDENGWVRAIPPEVKRVGTIFGWRFPKAAASRVGRYVVRYDGLGSIRLGGDARVIAKSIMKGWIIFENRKGKVWWLDITQTDPQNTGDYIRNISIVAERHLDLYDAGAVFNPEWLALIEDSRTLRFMDWMGTNNSRMIEWDDRPRQHMPYSGKGHAVEDMVWLANKVGAEPWFTMPHQADETYIRNFAEYVRDHLDPRLTAWVEWSNETWNWSFKQTHWALDQSEAKWGSAAHPDYGAKMAVKTAVIWRDVFKDQPKHRLKTVLGTKMTDPKHSRKQLEATVWKAKEPDTFVEPKLVFDALAVTNYFGGPLSADATERTNLLRAMRDPTKDINAYIKGRLLSRDFKRSLPVIQIMVNRQKAIADEFGLDLILYEGGQHVHQSIRAKTRDISSTKEQVEDMGKVLAAFARSPEMGGLYNRLFKDWVGVGDGPFMQYSDIGPANRFGSWGLYESVDDTSSRSRNFEKFGRKTKPWWPAQSGAHFQQGRIVRGTDQADDLFGSREEDYLLSGKGDDHLRASPGSDGLNGGEGQDHVSYTGQQASYVIKNEGKGVRVSGPDGDDYLTGIETISFQDGSVQILNQILKN